MHLIPILFILLILGGWLTGALGVIFAHPRGPIGLRLLSILAAFLLAVGAIGFFGNGCRHLAA